MNLDEAVQLLELEEAINRNMTELSGGELQRVAIAATIMKDSDIYFFDEPSSYLDIYQRMKVARIIEKLAEEKRSSSSSTTWPSSTSWPTTSTWSSVPRAPTVSSPSPGRSARPSTSIWTGTPRRRTSASGTPRSVFESHPPRRIGPVIDLLEYPELEMPVSRLQAEGRTGSIKIGETVGIVGPNAIGKTTFVKMLAGVQEPTVGEGRTAGQGQLQAAVHHARISMGRSGSCSTPT